MSERRRSRTPNAPSLADPSPAATSARDHRSTSGNRSRSTSGNRSRAAHRLVASLLLAAFACGLGDAHAQTPPPLPPASSTAPPLPPPTAKKPPPPPPPPPGASTLPPTGQAPSSGRPPPPPPYYPPPTTPYYGPAPTPYYAPPPPAPPAPSEPPAILPYPDTDAPVPEGYRVDSRPVAGYLGIGIGLFTSGWATSALAGALAADHAANNPSPGSPGPDAWTPMYFPVAGPFVTLATVRPGPAEMGLLLTGGIFQTAGLLGILLGSLRRSYRLVRVAGAPDAAPLSLSAAFTASAPRAGAATVDVAPMAGAGFVGVRTTGCF